MLSDQVSLGGVNYVIGSFMFGSIPHVEAMASIRRFAEDVMPAVKAAEAVAASTHKMGGRKEVEDA